VTIYTDRQVTLDSLRNNSIHTQIIADIRGKLQLNKQNWTIHFGWIKSHSGIEGNELADRLAKAAEADTAKLKIQYEKTTESTTATELMKERIAKWQSLW